MIPEELKYSKKDFQHFMTWYQVKKACSKEMKNEIVFLILYQELH
jgi:hypothetical protein